MSGVFMEWCSYVLRATNFIQFSGSNSWFSKSKKDNSKNISRSLSAYSHFAFNFSTNVSNQWRWQGNDGGKKLATLRKVINKLKSFFLNKILHSVRKKWLKTKNAIEVHNVQEVHGRESPGVFEMWWERKHQLFLWVTELPTSRYFYDHVRVVTMPQWTIVCCK